jgi:hypothetical protein
MSISSIGWSEMVYFVSLYRVHLSWITILENYVLNENEDSLPDLPFSEIYSLLITLPTSNQ